MQKKGIVSQDLLAIIVIVFGALGFILWGIGLSTAGNRFLQWLGASIVALIGFIVAFLSRWLR